MCIPDAELAPRDIVARAIFAEHQAGRRPMLDTRAALGAEVITKFPAVAEACRAAGIDPAREPIPVAPAAHYHMGGIETDAQGRASLGNLWVCGEASSTGLHGANRLASNGLLEALVYARICALGIETALPDLTEADLVPLEFADGSERVDEALVTELRRVMTNHVGVMRDAEGLRFALREIARIEAESGKAETGPSQAMLNMTATATLIAASACCAMRAAAGISALNTPKRTPPWRRGRILPFPRRSTCAPTRWSSEMSLPDFLLEPLVRMALTEDLAPMGDATTRAVILRG